MNPHKKETEIHNCNWCGQKTDFPGTKECNRCWELRHRIETEIELAAMIFNTLKTEDIKS